MRFFAHLAFVVFPMASVDTLRYVGMRITLTRNVNKEMDYVNGMTATVEGATPHGVRVRTRTGYVVMLYPWTDEDRTVFYPFRAGLSCLQRLRLATRGRVSGPPC